MAITPNGRQADASPLGKGPRRLSDYEREIAHALIRKGMDKTKAIIIARGLLKKAAATGRWGDHGKAGAKTRAGAKVSIAQRKDFAAYVPAKYDLAFNPAEPRDARGHWSSIPGLTFSERPGEVIAFSPEADAAGGQLAGQVKYADDGEVYHLRVAPMHRNMGLAKELLRRAKRRNPLLHHSGTLTGDGKAYASRIPITDLAFDPKEPRDPHTGKWIKGLSAKDLESVVTVVGSTKYDFDPNTGTFAVKPGQKAQILHLGMLPMGAKFSSGAHTYTKTGDDVWTNEAGAEAFNAELESQLNLGVTAAEHDAPEVHLTPYSGLADINKLDVGTNVHIYDPDLAGETLMLSKVGPDSYKVAGVDDTISGKSVMDMHEAGVNANKARAKAKQAKVQAKTVTAADLKAMGNGATMMYDSPTGSTSYKATKHAGSKDLPWHSVKDGWMSDEQLAEKAWAQPPDKMAAAASSAAASYFKPGVVAGDPHEGDVLTANFPKPVPSYSGQMVSNQPWVFKNGTWQTISLTDGKPHAIDVDAMVSMIGDQEAYGSDSAFNFTVGPPKATNPMAVAAAAAMDALKDKNGKVDPTISIPPVISPDVLSKFKVGDKFATSTLGGNVQVWKKTATDTFRRMTKSGKESKTTPVTGHFILKSYKSLMGNSANVPYSPPKPVVAKPKVPPDVEIGTYGVNGLDSAGDEKFPQITDGSDIAKLPAKNSDAYHRLQRYTEDWAGDINPELREVAKNGGETDSLDVEDFDRGFHPTTKPATLYRRVPVPGGDLDGFVLSRKDRIGKTFTDPGYSSCSWDGSQYSGGFCMKIHVPKGTPAQNAEPVSSYESEHEIVLGRGMKYRIDNIRKVKNANGMMTVVDATVVGKNAPVYAHIKRTPAYKTEKLAPTNKVLKKQPWEMGPHSTGTYDLNSPLSQIASSLKDAPVGSVVLGSKNEVLFKRILFHPSEEAHWASEGGSGPVVPDDKIASSVQTTTKWNNEIKIVKPMVGAPDYSEAPAPWHGAANLVQPPATASADYWQGQLISAPVGAKLWGKSGALVAEKREAGWWNIPTDQPAIAPSQMSKNLAQIGGFTMAWGFPPKKFHPKPSSSAKQQAEAAGVKPSASVIPLLKALQGKKPTTTPIWGNTEKSYTNLQIMAPGTVLYDPDNPGEWYVKATLGWTKHPSGKNMSGLSMDEMIALAGVGKKWRTYA